MAEANELGDDIFWSAMASGTQLPIWFGMRESSTTPRQSLGLPTG